MSLPVGLSIGKRTKLSWLKACETGDSLPWPRARSIWPGAKIGDLWQGYCDSLVTNSLLCFESDSETVFYMNILDTRRDRFVLFEFSGGLFFNFIV
jgi:hypothetical protein